MCTSLGGMLVFRGALKNLRATLCSVADVELSVQILVGSNETSPFSTHYQSVLWKRAHAAAVRHGRGLEFRTQSVRPGTGHGVPECFGFPAIHDAVHASFSLEWEPLSRQRQLSSFGCCMAKLLLMLHVEAGTLCLSVPTEKLTRVGIIVMVNSDSSIWQMRRYLDRVFNQRTTLDSSSCTLPRACGIPCSCPGRT
jgi:hypothetical protein